MPPRVSVLMPLHNCEIYVREAIDSILAQTYADFELIIVDDASTDGSVAVIESYHDGRIKLLRNSTNLGAALSRNRGLEVSCGAYIAMQDADDRSMPTRLAQQVQYLEAHPELQAVGTWATAFLDDTSSPSCRHSHPTDTREIADALIARKHCFTGASLMCRAAELKRLGGYRPLVGAEDHDLLFRLTDEQLCLGNVPDYLYCVRSHAMRTVNTRAAEIHACGLLVLDAMRKRRQGSPDPLDGLGKSELDDLTSQTVQGHGRLGHLLRAEQHWRLAGRAWAEHRPATLLAETAGGFISSPLAWMRWVCCGIEEGVRPRRRLMALHKAVRSFWRRSTV